MTRIKTPIANEIIIEFPVDEAFVNLAEQEAFAIILQRKADFEKRWNQRFKFSNRHKIIMRKITLPLGGLLVVASLICYFVYQNNSFLWLSVIFLALLLSDIFGDKIEGIMWQKSIKQSKKLAKICMGTSRQFVPFLASYRFKHKSIAYFRDKNDKKNHQWLRELKGVAVQGECVTLFFKNETTLSPPTMVVLHDNPAEFRKFFVAAGIACFDEDKGYRRFFMADGNSVSAD